MQPWSRFSWYRNGVAGCFWIALAMIVLLWLIERLGDWLI